MTAMIVLQMLDLTSDDPWVMPAWAHVGMCMLTSQYSSLGFGMKYRVCVVGESDVWAKDTDTDLNPASLQHRPECSQ